MMLLEPEYEEFGKMHTLSKVIAKLKLLDPEYAESGIRMLRVM